MQNAFKFTEPHTAVNLSAYAVADRVLIDVEDHCGGLLPNEAETMFLPFTQSGQNKTGLGLGLSLSRRSVEANRGPSASAMFQGQAASSRLICPVTPLRN